MLGRLLIAACLWSLTLGAAPGLAEPRRITVGGDAAYAPIEYLEDGKPKGLVIDILKAMERESDLTFDIRLGRWGAVQRQLLDGELDVLALISATEERQAVYDFSKETIRLTYSLFCRQDDLRIQSPEDLRGMIVGVTAGGLPRAVLGRTPGVRLVVITDYSAGFRALLAGELDAVAADTWVGGFTVQRDRLRGIRMVREPFAFGHAGFAVKKGNRAMLAQIDQALARLRASGRLDEILAHWSSQEVYYVTRESLARDLMIGGLALALGALGAGVGWILLLRRQVRRKTLEIREANETLERRVRERTTDLQRSEERFRLLLELAPVIIVILDLDWRIIGLNAEAERIYGVRTAEVEGRNYLDVFIPEDHREHVRGAMTRIAADQRLDSFENDIVSRDGARRLVSWHARQLSIRADQAPVCLAFGVDITEKRRLEDQLRQAEKLQAVGQLAGGIAHDFNNQLTGIIGFAQLLANRTDDPKAHRYGEMIVRAARHAASLTRQLLTFARKGQQKREPTDVHAIIRDVVALLQRSLDKSITVVTDLAAERSVVDGDPSLLQSSLLNLGINARDAMPEGGTLTIATRTEVVGGAPMLVILVRDSGVGMGEDVLKRIYEPFFTTKGADRGSGLGLALVHGTIVSHGGTIHVESRVDKGTTFRIQLPLKATDAIPVDPELVQPSGAGAGIRVLVVDDEPIVRAAAVDLLSGLGCEVSACVNGREAVDRISAAPYAFDALLMDVDMPVLGGREALQEIRRCRGDLEVLLCSGYALDDLVTETDAHLRFLHKPYDVYELAAALRVLQSKGAARRH